MGDSVDHNEHQTIIPKATIKNPSNKNYSPTKLKSQNFLTNISYNCLKCIDSNNASFIIVCYTCILFNLNPFFLYRKFDDKRDREYIETLWNYLIPNNFYIYICRNDNFIPLNKLSLKYQNAFDILINFILEDNNDFLVPKKYFKENALLYQYIYSTAFPNNFCRVDDYGVKSKLVFEVAYAGYKKESLLFVQLQPPTGIKQKQNEIVDEAAVVAVVEIAPPSKSTAVQKSKKRKINANNIAENVLLKKKRDEKKAKLLSELEANDFHMKHIKSNVNK